MAQSGAGITKNTSTVRLGASTTSAPWMPMIAPLAPTASAFAWKNADSRTTCAIAHAILVDAKLRAVVVLGQAVRGAVPALAELADVRHVLVHAAEVALAGRHDRGEPRVSLKRCRTVGNSWAGGFRERSSQETRTRS